MSLAASTSETNKADYMWCACIIAIGRLHLGLWAPLVACNYHHHHHHHHHYYYCYYYYYYYYYYYFVLHNLQVLWSNT